VANSLITNQYIARKAIKLARNKNSWIRMVDRQYDSEFERSGAVPGQSIRIRQPVDYVLRRGANAVIQNSTQNVVTLTVASQTGVDMGFTSVDRTMNVDRFTETFIVPAVNVVIGGLAVDTMAVVEGGSSAFSARFDANGNLLTPNAGTWLHAKAALENTGVPYDDYKVVMSPDTQATTVEALAGYFNSQPLLAKQYENGDMSRALGFDWMDDQTILIHTTGTLASAGSTYAASKGWSFTTVAGANQTGNVLTVAALTGTLKKGDIICIDLVCGANPVTKSSTGGLRTFAVTSDVPSGSTTIPIYPALLGPDGTGNQQQYQTVMSSPTNGAVIYSKIAASVAYRKNIAFVPKAVALVTVDLIMPPNVDCAREVFDEMSVRVLTQYAFASDVLGTRLDLLSGSVGLKPEWVVTVADPV